MKKSDFVAAIASKTGLSKTKSDEVVNAVIAVITETLQKGEKVTLTGFGTFEVRARAERKGRDIRTKTEITIPASKRPVFSAGAVLKESINPKAEKTEKVAEPKKAAAPKKK